MTNHLQNYQRNMSIEFLQGLKMAHNDQNNGYYGNQFIVQYKYSKLTIVIFLLQQNLIFVWF